MKIKREGRFRSEIIRRLQNSVYLRQMIVFFLTLCMLPLILINVLLVSHANRNMRAQVEKLNLQMLRQGQLVVDSDLARLEDELSDLAANDQIAALGHIEGERLSPNDVTELITNKYSYFTDIVPNDVFLVSGDYRYVISNRGIRPIGEAFSPAYRALFDREFPFSTVYLFAPNNEIYPSVLRGLNFDSVNIMVRTPRYAVVSSVLIANIDAAALRARLSEKTDLSDILLLDEQGRAVFSSSLLPADLTKDLFHTVLEHGDLTGIFEFQHNYSVCYAKSEIVDWYYVSVIDLRALFPETVNLARLAFLLVLCAVMMLTTVTVWGSVRFYRPIETIYKLMSPGSTEKLSRQNDEFEQIRRRLASDRAAYRQLEYVLTTQSTQLKSEYLTRLYSGRMRPEEIEQHLEFMGFSPQWTCMSLLVFRLGALNGTTFDGYADLAVKSIQNIAEEMLLPQEHLPGAVVDGRLAILCAGKKQNDDACQKEWARLASALYETIWSTLRIPVLIGISPAFERAESAYAAYAQTLAAMSSAGAQLSGVISAKSFSARQDPYPVFPQQGLTALLSAMDAGNAAEARQAGDRLVAGLYDEQLPPNLRTRFYVRLLEALFQHAQEMGVEQTVLSGSMEVVSAPTAQEAEALFWADWVAPLLSAIRENRGEHQKVSEVLIALLEKHQYDLTLEQCAQMYHYSPSYLSRIFLRETGVSFKTYVSQAKLRIAKELLTETDKQIAQIAQELSYNNSQNFIRYFKSVEGMTPSQYRQKHAHPKKEEP